MDLTPRLQPGRQRIQSYGDGGFRINGQRHNGSVILTADSVAAWPRGAIDQIDTDDFADLAGTTPAIEILLLGCGERAVLPLAALRAHLRTLGIGLDVMDTGAACRTFNVLVQEDRRVAAALIAVA